MEQDHLRSGNVCAVCGRIAGVQLEEIGERYLTSLGGAVIRTSPTQLRQQASLQADIFHT